MASVLHIQVGVWWLNPNVYVTMRWLNAPWDLVRWQPVPWPKTVTNMRDRDLVEAARLITYRLLGGLLNNSRFGTRSPNTT